MFDWKLDRFLPMLGCCNCPFNGSPEGDEDEEQDESVAIINGRVVRRSGGTHTASGMDAVFMDYLESTLGRQMDQKAEEDKE